MSAEEEKPRDEDVLFPDSFVSVGGASIRVAHVPMQREEVLVRELTFGQTMSMERFAAPIIASIAEVLDSSADDVAVDWGAVVAAISKHPDEFKALICASTGKPVEWLDSLTDRDGRRVVVTFMKVNWDFFIDRLRIRHVSRVSLSEVAGQ